MGKRAESAYGHPALSRPVAAPDHGSASAYWEHGAVPRLQPTKREKHSKPPNAGAVHPNRRPLLTRRKNSIGVVLRHQPSAPCAVASLRRSQLPRRLPSSPRYPCAFWKRNRSRERSFPANAPPPVARETHPLPGVGTHPANLRKPATNREGSGANERRARSRRRGAGAHRQGHRQPHRLGALMP